MFVRFDFLYIYIYCHVTLIKTFKLGSSLSLTCSIVLYILLYLVTTDQFAAGEEEDEELLILSSSLPLPICSYCGHRRSIWASESISGAGHHQDQWQKRNMVSVLLRFHVIVVWSFFFSLVYEEGEATMYIRQTPSSVASPALTTALSQHDFSQRWVTEKCTFGIECFYRTSHCKCQ